MASTHVQDFLIDALQEAIRFRASLCLFSHQVNPDESPGDDREITPTRLMWNHFAAIHTSHRAVQRCALDLSDEIEADALMASALAHILHLLDFIEERSSLTSVAQTEINEAVETAVRAQATLEMLAGSWQTIRQIFKQYGDERNRNSSHQAARSASIAASCWRALYEALLLERASESGCECQDPAGDQKRRDAALPVNSVLGINLQARPILPAIGGGQAITPGTASAQRRPGRNPLRWRRRTPLRRSLPPVHGIPPAPGQYRQRPAGR